MALVIAAVFGLLVLAAAAYFLMLPKHGRIIVKATDPQGGAPKLEVFLDGQRTPCETAPCILDQVAAKNHIVRVVAHDFEVAPDQTLAVEADKDSTVEFLLRPSKQAPAKVATSLKVLGSGQGAKLFVDGKELGPLPQTVADITPGEHSVKVVSSDRYQAFEKTITVESGKTFDLGEIRLKVVRGKLDVKLVTQGATVVLVSGNDRRLIPKTLAIDPMDASKTWTVEATKEGFADFREVVSFDDGQAEKTVTVEMLPKGAPTPAASAAPAPTPSVVAAAATPNPAATPAATPNTAKEPGYLNINSIPPSSCFLDGRPLGMTPQIKVQVNPGPHTVKFVHAELGITKQISVNVGPGETKPAVLKLQ